MIKKLLTFILVCGILYPIFGQEFASTFLDPVLLTSQAGEHSLTGNTLVRTVSWNNDSWPDLLVGNQDLIHHFAGSPEGFIYQGMVEDSNGPISLPGKDLGATLEDLDGDGLADLVFNYPQNKFRIYYNQGNSQEPLFLGYEYLAGQEGALTVERDTKGLFDFTDWDGDGDLDLVTGQHSGEITLFINNGNSQAPIFTEGVPIKIENQPILMAYRPSPRFYDVNGSGIEDMLYGINWGRLGILFRDPNQEEPVFREKMDLLNQEKTRLEIRSSLGWNVYPEWIDYDGDGVMDLVTGSGNGGIFLLKGLPGDEIPAYQTVYQQLENDLQQTSERVNGNHFSLVIYGMDAQEVEENFQRYFQNHPLNYALYFNLGNPAFYWRDNHQAIQQGLSALFIKDLKAAFVEEDIESLESRWKNNEEEAFGLLLRINFLARLIGDQTELSRNEIEQLGESIFQILENYQLFTEIHLPKENYPYINIIRHQLALTAHYYAHSLGWENRLATALNLPPDRAYIYLERQCLLLDNGMFSTLHLEKIREFLDIVPPEFLFPRIVLCYTEYQDLDDSLFSVHTVYSPLNVFNVFLYPVDRPGSSQFPSDYESVKTSRFFSVFAHEFNHGVDSQYIHNNPQLENLRLRLIDQAGDNPQNYLRNMFEPGFFTNAPQEFFASISNMYFTSSRDSLKYALLRQTQGNPQPLQHFLYFASVYTQNNICYFYRISETGEMNREQIPVTTQNGVITSMQLDNIHYDFSDLW